MQLSAALNCPPFPSPLSFLQCQFNPCFPGVKCVNTAPGYRCEACPLGFTGTPVEGVGVLFAQTNKQVTDAVERGRLDAFTVLETSQSGFNNNKEQRFRISMSLMWGALICSGSFIA